ncbi:hypothetical protein PV341_43315 [Streptomyces sp. PA03-1a]|nr:hypothetical protein [Streptomyces sp. PA03-1a]MDX2813398.1 hypothetical protein [Streptomyces sp. PA03-5A]
MWWAALPPPTNVSDKDLELTGATVLRVPKGIKILQYGAYSANDTDGIVMLGIEGDSEDPHFERLKNHFHKAVKVRAKGDTDIYYVVRMKITGPIKGNLRDTRFTYRQDGRSYEQTLKSDVALRVEQP